MNTICVINESSRVTNSDLAPLIEALQEQWNTHLQAVWPGVGQAVFSLLEYGKEPPPRSQWLVFLDNTDRAQELAYHDLTNDGMPMAKVFTETLAEQGHVLSVAASHEICEMAVNPNLTASYQDAYGTWWAAEICDPVEADAYGYLIDNVLVSNFVTPAWFDLPSPIKNFDKLGLVQRAFEVLSGGYGQQWNGATEQWQQVNGFLLTPFKQGLPVVSGRRERRHRPRMHWFRSEVDHQRRKSV